MNTGRIMNRTRIGCLLLDKGLVSREQLDQAIETQKRHRTPCLGRILVQQGLISTEQLNECLREQAHVRVFKQTRLGNLLVERGLVDRSQLDAAVRQQKAHQGLTIGRALIEQGVISESQLRACLRDQRQMRLSAVILALSITPFQAAFADHSVEQSDETWAKAIAVSVNAPSDATVKTYADGAALTKVVELAAEAAWEDWREAQELTLTLAGDAEIDEVEEKTGASSIRATYRFGLSDSGLNFKSVSRSRLSTSSYRVKLSPSGEVKVNYKLLF